MLDVGETVPRVMAVVLFPLLPLASIAVRLESEVVGVLAVISALLGVAVATTELLETMEMDDIAGK